MNADALRHAIRLDHAVSDRVSQKSLMGYLDRVVIDSRPTPQRFGLVAEDWQWDRVNAIEAAVENVAGFRDSYTGPLNFYFGYAKGHDKTSFIARLFNWLLGYSKRKLRIYAAAADTDQAKLIRDAMVAETELNPWLAKRVRIYNKYAWGSGGSLEILAADAPTAQGKTPDLLILDEVTHWKTPALFDALFTARDKRPGCVTMVTTNAGVTETWQWALRNQAAASKRWRFFEQPVRQMLASWMDADAIAENRKLVTPSEARRLYDNEWLNAGEVDGFVTFDAAVACRVADTKGGGGDRSRYVAAVDYGPRRDRTALALIRVDDTVAADGSPQRRLSVVDLQCWHQPGGEVQLEAVEKWMEEQQRLYSPTFVCDEYQLLNSIQRFEKLGYRIERFAPRGGAANYEMAANLRSLIASRRIRWPESVGPTLPTLPVLVAGADSFESELSQLLLRVTPSGYRFDHKSGRHDDRAVAVGMAALFAVSLPPQPQLAPPLAVATPQFDRLAPPRRPLFGVR